MNETEEAAEAYVRKSACQHCDIKRMHRSWVWVAVVVLLLPSNPFFCEGDISPMPKDRNLPSRDRQTMGPMKEAVAGVEFQWLAHFDVVPRGGGGATKKNNRQWERPLPTAVVVSSQQAEKNSSLCWKEKVQRVRKRVQEKVRFWHVRERARGRMEADTSPHDFAFIHRAWRDEPVSSSLRHLRLPLLLRRCYCR